MVKLLDEATGVLRKQGQKVMTITVFDERTQTFVSTAPDIIKGEWGSTRMRMNEIRFAIEKWFEENPE